MVPSTGNFVVPSNYKHWSLRQPQPSNGVPLKKEVIDLRSISWLLFLLQLREHGELAKQVCPVKHNNLGLIRLLRNGST
jgi:hypothetical protein